MTTPSGPAASPSDPGLSVLENERRQLISLAYRLLGSVAEAEDVVQETYARWYAMTPRQREDIASPGGWLTTVASRICLDLLGSARARRERYVGEWIPEPLPDGTEWISGRWGGATVDPADRVTLDESINMAFLVVLDSMTPAERVAFVLHDVFRYSFAEVAEIVGRTRRHAVNSPRRPAAAFTRRSPARPRRPDAPTSSEPSSRHGRPRTSTPSSACWHPTPRRPATAADSSPPHSARWRVPNRSHASSPNAPKRSPA